MLTGLAPRFITAELTLANVDPNMAELKGLAAESLAAAEREKDGLWARERSTAWPRCAPTRVKIAGRWC